MLDTLLREEEITPFLAQLFERFLVFSGDLKKLLFPKSAGRGGSYWTAFKNKHIYPALKQAKARELKPFYSAFIVIPEAPAFTWAPGKDDPTKELEELGECSSIRTLLTNYAVQHHYYGRFLQRGFLTYDGFLFLASRAALHFAARSGAKLSEISAGHVMGTHWGEKVKCREREAILEGDPIWTVTIAGQQTWFLIDDYMSPEKRVHAAMRAGAAIRIYAPIRAGKNTPENRRRRKIPYPPWRPRRIPVERGDGPSDSFPLNLFPPESS